jgi:Ca-activated chloride channel homolog
MGRTPHTKFVSAYGKLRSKDLSWAACTFLAIFLGALITLALPPHQLRAQSQETQKSPAADSQKPAADSQATQSSDASSAKPPADSQPIQSSDAGPIKPPPEPEAPPPTPANQPPPDTAIAPAQPAPESTASATTALQSANKKKPKAYKVDVELTLVPVSVTDPYGRMVTGLDQENFRIFEDNKEQEIARFSSEDVPISIGVIFDMSGSMADKFEKSRLAAVQFFKTANPEDEFCLVNFNDRAQLVSSFTASVEDLQERLMYTAAHGETALFDGIYLGLSQMKGARNSKKALLIISDGGDNHSRYSEMDVRKFVKEADVQIFAIGIFDKGDYKSLEEQNGPALLGEITELTGGRVFRVNSLKDLPDVATKISMELRNQYVLGYRPTNQARDGKWRKIKIRLRPPKGLPPLQVYSRTGYYASGH